MTGAIYLLLQSASVLLLVTLHREASRRRLAAAHAELAAAGAALAETSRTQERLRISRELHDLVGHQLTALALELEIATHTGADPGGHVARARALAGDLLTDVRTTVGQLRGRAPDLAATLERIAEQLPRPVVHVHVADGVTADEERTLAVVRCVQEILTNAIRHGDADTVWIDLSPVPGGGLRLSARDDGRGPAADVVPERAARPRRTGRSVRRIGRLGPRHTARVRRHGGAAVTGPTTPGGRPVRVVLVDDQTLVRHGIRGLLGLADGVEVVAEAGDGAEGWPPSSSTTRTCCCWTCACPSRRAVGAGRAALARARRAGARPHHLRRRRAGPVRAARRGPRIPAQDVTLDQLVGAVRTLADGGTLISPAVTDRLLRAVRDGPPRPTTSPASPAGPLGPRGRGAAAARRRAQQP